MTYANWALTSNAMGKKETNFKQTDIGLIPHDWEVVSLGEHSRKIGSGKTPRGGEAVYTLSGIPFVRSQNVGYGRMHLKGISYISEALHNEQKSSEIDVNDVLLNITGASIGRCSVADKYVVGGNINQHVCIIRLTPSSFISSYLCNFLLSNNGQEQIQLLQSGGSREGINFGQVGNIKVPLPPLKEQKRIAEVLSHFDKHIDNLAALLEKRKQVKAATMHALLSGTTRLPGFTAPWGKRTIEQISNRYDNLRIPVAENLRVKGCTPYYGANGIQGYVQGYTHDGEFVLIAEDGASDLSNYPTQYVIGKIWVNNHAHVLQGKSGQCSNCFLCYALKTPKYKEIVVGGERAKLNAKTLMEIELFIPTILKEQEAIADILSNMDRGIEALEEQIEKYRQMKEGAMEELLTGKVRLI